VEGHWRPRARALNTATHDLLSAHIHLAGPIFGIHRSITSWLNRVVHGDSKVQLVLLVASPKPALFAAEPNMAPRAAAPAQMPPHTYRPWCPGDFAFRNALKYGLEENSFAHLDRRSLQFIPDEGGGPSVSLALASTISADRTRLSAGTAGPVIQEVRCLGSYCYTDVKTTPTILVPGARCF
jgi:hypothetical protein